MKKTFAMAAAAASVTVLLGAGIATAQPALSPQGGSGNMEMDHSRMGGASQGQTQGGAAPVLRPQGGGGNAEMDHSRMGSSNMSGPSGGTITGNSGSGGGPEVQHGHAPAPAQPAQRR